MTDRPIHVVTGASSGIGRAVAVALASRGERVAGVARSRADLAKLRDDAGPNIVVVPADITTPEGLHAVASVTGTAPSVASIVHGAGSLVEPQAFTAIDPDALIEHFRVHVAAPIALAVRLRNTSPVARVVHLDSYSASTPRDGWAAYSIVKAAAQMTARCSMQELTDTIVLRVFPGAVHTPLVERILASPSPAGETFRTLHAEGRIVAPAVIGEFVADLLLNCSDDDLRSDPVREFRT